MSPFTLKSASTFPKQGQTFPEQGQKANEPCTFWLNVGSGDLELLSHFLVSVCVSILFWIPYSNASFLSKVRITVNFFCVCLSPLAAKSCFCPFFRPKVTKLGICQLPKTAKIWITEWAVAIYIYICGRGLVFCLRFWLFERQKPHILAILRQKREKGRSKKEDQNRSCFFWSKSALFPQF